MISLFVSWCSRRPKWDVSHSGGFPAGVDQPIAVGAGISKNLLDKTDDKNFAGFGFAAPPESGMEDEEIRSDSMVFLENMKRIVCKI